MGREWGGGEERNVVAAVPERGGCSHLVSGSSPHSIAPCLWAVLGHVEGGAFEVRARQRLSGDTPPPPSMAKCTHHRAPTDPYQPPPTATGATEATRSGDISMGLTPWPTGSSAEDFSPASLTNERGRGRLKPTHVVGPLQGGARAAAGAPDGRPQGPSLPSLLHAPAGGGAGRGEGPEGEGSPPNLEQEVSVACPLPPLPSPLVGGGRPAHPNISTLHPPP